MTDETLTIADLAGKTGQELGVSNWVEIDQAMIDSFAATTRDEQWIHVDVERARRESTYGAPVAHGFLTLSLISGMSYEIGIRPKDVSASINYGLDKLRFLSPVKAGARVRLRSTLMSFDEKSPGQFLMKCSCVVEIDGEERPALVAETLVLLIAA
ncbi:MaoC family dehydratase [Mesorhizobium sp. CAU 1732]|uniref:MaoC family dehydratase n=1 Tax=Mesorhizobium sp. CAU 1732 TaxID=3140358 RepID=UPI0032610B41